MSDFLINRIHKFHFGERLEDIKILIHTITSFLGALCRELSKQVLNIDTTHTAPAILLLSIIQ